MKLKYYFILFLAAASLACFNRSTRREVSSLEEELAEELMKALEDMPDSFWTAQEEVDPDEIEVSSLEAEFWDIYARFDTLMIDYNYHLVDAKTHPEETEKEFFMAFCYEDEMELEASADMSSGERLEVIWWWCSGLYECCEEFRNQFLSHLSFFHPDVALDIELAELIEIPVESVEDLVDRVEKNVEITRANVRLLQGFYLKHIQTDH